jgi:hypothetical protein
LAYETGNLDIDVEYYDVPRLIPVSVQLGLMAGLHACGHKANLSLELTRALLIALENPGAAEQWLRGEGVFSPAKKETGLKFSSWFWKKFQPKKGG